MKFVSTTIFPFILFIGLVVIATFVVLGIFLVMIKKILCSQS